MSAESLPAEERFNLNDAIILDESLVEVVPGRTAVYVGNCRLSVRDAKTLRDWLNTVIP